MKIRIFIGSSGEGLKIATQTKDFLENSLNAECVVWDQFGVFEYNKSTFEALLNGRFFYDFVILVATSDDLVWWRKIITRIPRDNVIFEFGLYLGSLGESRTDLNGITLPRFKILKNNLPYQLEKVSFFITEKIKQNELHILPSTTLAIGYFHSFLKPATAVLIETNNCITIDGKSFSCKQIKVIIPDTLSDNIASKAKVFFESHNIEFSEIQNSKRPFKIQFAYDDSDPNHIVVDQNDYCKKVVKIQFESEYQ